MKLKAFHRRDDLNKGEWPNLLIDPALADAWWGRNPFEERQIEGISPSLIMDPMGTTDGHNTVTDSTITDSMFVDHEVPVSPLFVKDLVGRVIYLGFGPDRKDNTEWARYQPLVGPLGTIPEDEINPFVPMCTFPRFSRDVEAMEGHELLEQVFLTKFRCLEMSMTYSGMLSGADEEAPLIAATYFGANLYPYKLRLDTYYADGWKLPQTQMVYARGEAEGVSPSMAKRMTDYLMSNWNGRIANSDYARWLSAMGETEVQRMYAQGCTLIPTFEACNGYHVVGEDFGLEDYWPGRAVLGLHDVMERRADKAPYGTILDVLEPGYVTATQVKPAKVVVSDGSGYVSPHTDNPLPLIPNMNLPHQRALDSWYATWIPTHPEHFEVPAIWGYDLNEGRFMQLSGPLWDPLHYYYESVDLVLAAFDKTPLDGRRGLVMVPEAMEHRFYPVVPLKGFDTFSSIEYERRIAKSVLPRSCLKRVPTETFMAGIGYHPLPAEFEFELDTFWYPELHPLNRTHGLVPEELAARIVPVIDPRVTISDFTPTVEVDEEVTWLTDEERLMTPVDSPLANYPQLMRYLLSDLDVADVVHLCPVPYLSDPGDMLNYGVTGWWTPADGVQLDGPLAVDDLVSNAYDGLWDLRQKGGQLMKFRHMVYRTNLPLYMLGWWYGWGVSQLEDAMAEWIASADVEREEAAGRLAELPA